MGQTRKTLVRIGLAVVGLLLLGFIAIQFVPVQRTNPPVTSEPNWDSPQTRALAERACFDCHSNETDWPWYSHIAPVSWTVARDVQVGRQVINFSDWEHVRGEGRSAGEMAEVIRGGWMPPANYLSTHPEARLTQAEKDALVQGLQATLSGN
jgi:hypothetical protein